MKCVKLVPCRLDGLHKPYFFDATLTGKALKLCPSGCIDARPCRSCALCWRDLKRSIKTGGRRISVRH